MRVLKWFVINGLFVACMYLGFYEQHEGAYNVAMFMAWIAIVLSPLMLMGDVLKAMNKKGRSMPAWISISFDIMVVLAFVWFGALVTAIFYAIHIFITEGAWSEALKLKPLDDGVDSDELHNEKLKLHDEEEALRRAKASARIAEIKEALDYAEKAHMKQTTTKRAK